MYFFSPKAIFVGVQAIRADYLKLNKEKKRKRAPVAGRTRTALAERKPLDEPRHAPRHGHLTAAPAALWLPTEHRPRGPVTDIAR